MSDLVEVNKNNQPHEILKKPYVRRLLPAEDGGYTATIQEFPGLVAEGNTVEETMQNLDDAALSWIEVSLDSGRMIKEPVDFDGCSGKIALRIPRSLHLQAAELAELEGASLNQVLANAIAQYVSAKGVLNTVKGLLQAELECTAARRMVPSARFFIIKDSSDKQQHWSSYESSYEKIVAEFREIASFSKVKKGIAHG